MPLYEYRCHGCDARFELLSTWSRADAQRCPECGAEAERLVSAFAGGGGCEEVGGG